jgi:hypothetical protein
MFNPLGSGGIWHGFISSDFVRLRSLRSLNDVELYFVSLFQRLVAVSLDGTIVNEHIRAAVCAQKSESLSIVKPLHLSTVLGHDLSPK